MSIRLSSKRNYKEVLIRVFRSLPTIFVQRYVWFLIICLFILGTWWGWISYTKAYKIAIEEVETYVRTPTFPDEELGKIQDEIKRREEIFSGGAEERYPDPFGG